MPPSARTLSMLTGAAARSAFALIALAGLTGPSWAAERAPEVPFIYQVRPPQFPAADLSGEVGQRLLGLLRIRGRKLFDWAGRECRESGRDGDGLDLPLPDKPGDGLDYTLYRATGAVYAWAILLRFGDPEEPLPGVSRSDLERTAAAVVRGVARTHPANGDARAQPGWWNKHWALRIDYIYGMGAWLLWDKLDAGTRLQVARVLEFDADLYNNEPAPARLDGDTQAESNAWTSSGLAVAYCLLRNHPRRAIWGERAKEWMISAYATARDVDSDRVVDGRPLRRWLTGPNLFPDYTLENHGLMHPVYLAAVSEMVQTAVAYRLAGEAVPQAVTFNAGKVLDLLLVLNLPDGNHLYVQGTDYCSRNLSSFFQAGNLVPLEPDPLRNACFLRCLSSLEKMAAERPRLPLDGWLGWDDEFGTTWGLTGNYLMRRLFGSPREALPEAEIEPRLAGVHVFESGKFVVHRTPTTLSNFSWHESAKASQLLGLTIPLNKDIPVYPMPGSLLGDLREEGAAGADGGVPDLKLLSHTLNTRRDGFGLTLELERAGGKVRQNSAFISLPDGTSVYLEERAASHEVVIASASSANIVLQDDTRWVFQPRPRDYYGSGGTLTPGLAGTFSTSWVNVDNVIGYIALGSSAAQLSRRAGQPGIWRKPDETMYDTVRLSFATATATKERPAGPRAYAGGERISVFSLISCPNQRKEQTAALAGRVLKEGWLADRDGLLAVRIDDYLVYANFSAERRPVSPDFPANAAAPRSCGWFRVITDKED